MLRADLFRSGTALILALTPLAARASSFVLNEQSVSGLGVAFAGGAAQAEDPSTLFFNPAGIALLKQGEFQIGANYIAPSAEFHNSGSQYALPGTPLNGLPISGGNGGENAAVPHVIPNFFLTQPVFHSRTYGDLAVGVGVSVPFGLETDYSSDWVGRYQSRRTKLTTFDIQPTVAYRIFDRLSFGVSFDAQRASARLTQAIDFGLIAQQPLAQFYNALPAILAARRVPPAAIPGTIAATRQAYANAGFVPGGADGVSEITGDDWSYGFTVGALFEYLKSDRNSSSFLQDGRVGLSYRSAIDHTLEGDAKFRAVPLITAPGAPVQFPNPTAFQSVFFNQGGRADLALPDIFHFSAYQAFARQFAVMGDITWTRWSRLQDVPIVFENPGTPSSVLNIRYRDALRYAVGFEWYATDRLTFRTGFAYDETPIRGPEFRTPRIPDNNRYFLSAGIRWSPTNYMDLDLGYAHLFVDDPEVNVVDTQGHNLRGVYDASVDIVSASVTFRWGGARETASGYAKESKGYRK
ncbi:MAG: outer membrane protein transport protein [Verrucomicrobiota bacterium]|nr:outer membrane protein transport protein [Verrucomicrobiota bacterium]